MASFETMKNRVLVSDMTGKLYDIATCCARCNLPITSPEPVKIGKYLYNVDCGSVAEDTMTQENNAEKTRVIVRYEDLCYRALTTIIGQYGKLTVDGHEPHCGIDSCERTFARWECTVGDVVDYCKIRWPRKTQQAHRNMIIEHLEACFK